MQERTLTKLQIRLTQKNIKICFEGLLRGRDVHGFQTVLGERSESDDGKRHIAWLLCWWVRIELLVVRLKGRNAALFIQLMPCASRP